MSYLVAMAGLLLSVIAHFIFPRARLASQGLQHNKCTLVYNTDIHYIYIYTENRKNIIGLFLIWICNFHQEVH